MHCPGEKDHTASRNTRNYIIMALLRRLNQLYFKCTCVSLKEKYNLYKKKCRLSYHQQFVWYPGYHGYQFYAALPRVDLQWHLHCTLCITQWAKQRGQKESGDNSMTISKSFLLKYKSCNKKKYKSALVI